MLLLLIDYFKEVLAPRALAAKLFSIEAFVAAGVTLAFLSGELRPLLAKGLSVSGFASDMFKYSGMGMSAAVTVMALAARWADRDFSEFLRTQEIKLSARVRDYPTMMFRLSWTALTHWVGVVVAFAATLFVDDSVNLNAAYLSLSEKIWSAVLLFTFSYTTLNFLATVLVVSIMCNLRAVYMEHFRQSKGSSESR